MLLYRDGRSPTRNKVTEKELQLQVRSKQPRVGKVEKKERRIVDAANWRFMNIIGSGSIDLSLFPFQYPSERECFFYFGNHIETPYVSGLSQAPDVCNGNSWHRGKKNYEWRWRLKRGGGGGGGGGGGEQPSITSLFTDFSTGAMWIFVITEPKLPRSVFIRDSNDDF